MAPLCVNWRRARSKLLGAAPRLHPSVRFDIGFPHRGSMHLPTVRAGDTGSLPCHREGFDVGRNAGGRVLMGVRTREQEHRDATLPSSNPVFPQPRPVKSVPSIPAPLSRAADSHQGRPQRSSTPTRGAILRSYTKGSVTSKRTRPCGWMTKTSPLKGRQPRAP